VIFGGGVAVCLFTFVSASRGHLGDCTAFFLVCDMQQDHNIFHVMFAAVVVHFCSSINVSSLSPPTRAMMCLEINMEGYSL